MSKSSQVLLLFQRLGIVSLKIFSTAHYFSLVTDKLCSSRSLRPAEILVKASCPFVRRVGCCLLADGRCCLGLHATAIHPLWSRKRRGGLYRGTIVTRKFPELALQRAISIGRSLSHRLARELTAIDTIFFAVP